MSSLYLVGFLKVVVFRYLALFTAYLFSEIQIKTNDKNTSTVFVLVFLSLVFTLSGFLVYRFRLRGRIFLLHPLT